MRELEKISEEIRKAFEENTKNITDEDGCHHFVVDCCTATYLVNKIIRKHTNDNPCGDCSRRKWYQEGYKDGKNDNNGWIPISKDNIPDHEVLACNEDGCELIGYIDVVGYGFFCEEGESGICMYDVVAWMEKPEPYKPERSDNA